ncbi:glucosaminidase domain-containing protein [Chloroflexus sp.]|uniref:glucosaminidase domain-containing protein n=1 Tax=Chloroflexus sp. TaxID=1904827 RepID=UPI004049F8CD
MYTADSPILGPQIAAMDQMSRYILSRPHGEYTEKDIADVIIPAYLRVCIPVGVDPVLAVAQMIHETGNLTSFWSQRPQRNPAGIGVTGQWQLHQPTDLRGWAYNTQRWRWEVGVRFATWADDAIPAHVGRLLAYALPEGSETPPQRELIAKALGYRPFPRVFRGSAQTIKQLGRAHNPLAAQGAGWASPGHTYGEAIARLANQILAVPLE